MIFFADKIEPNFSYNTSYLSFSALAWQKTSCLFIISFVFLNFSVFCILYPICCKTQHLSRIFHSCFCSWSYYLVFQHVTVDSTFYNRFRDNATMSTIELKNIWSRSNFEFLDCSNCILDVFAEIFSYIWAGLFLRHVVGCWGSSYFYIVLSSFYNCFWIQSLYIHIWQVFIFFIELTFVHFKWTVFIQWMHSKRLILAICRLFWFTFMTWAWIGFNISRS